MTRLNNKMAFYFTLRLLRLFSTHTWSHNTPIKMDKLHNPKTCAFLQTPAADTDVLFAAALVLILNPHHKLRIKASCAVTAVKASQFWFVLLLFFSPSPLSRFLNHSLQHLSSSRRRAQLNREYQRLFIRSQKGAFSFSCTSCSTLRLKSRGVKSWNNVSLLA